MRPSVLTRKTHYWASILVAAPILVIFTTGILLQLRKDWAWVQPTEQKGSAKVPTVPPAQLLAACQANPDTGVKDWADVSRIDYRVSKGIVKVTTKSGLEVQIDSATGTVLQVAVRRSDWLVDLHEGEWFSPAVKYYVFLPSGFVLLFLWVSGVYLFFHPRWVRWRAARK